MAYTAITGARSERFPLQGCGCGRPLGQAEEPELSSDGVKFIAGLLISAVAIGWYFSRPRRVQSNRRRRRHHRRR